MNDEGLYLYNVTFIYRHFHITVTTLAADEDDAPTKAIEQMQWDSGIAWTIFDRAQEINVEKMEN